LIADCERQPLESTPPAGFGTLKRGANVVIQYSDMTKVMAQQHPGFAYNTPEIMRSMVTEAGYRILEENLTSLRTATSSGSRLPDASDQIAANR
jgi:acyl-coenzyme A synthetase/AMP-(fatty) acid ligase